MKKSFETDITMHLTRISGDVESTKTDIAHIKDKVNTAVQHLELQNGRLRSAENSRKSDTSAKYSVSVKGKQEKPEGLMKVLDMLNNSIGKQKETAPSNG